MSAAVFDAIFDFYSDKRQIKLDFAGARFTVDGKFLSLTGA